MIELQPLRGGRTGPPAVRVSPSGASHLDRRRSPVSRPLIALFLLAAVLTGCTSAPTAPTAPPPPVSTPVAPIGERVTAADIQPHLAALQRIADEHGGNRASPGPGYQASVDYVAGILREAGFEVTTPSYPVEDDDGDRATARNVIAQTRTGNPERVVLIGAHLDSVREGPGINDNGSGVGALLEIARRMGGSPDVANMVRFAFWGHEEEHYEGSRAYVAGLSRRERNAIMIYLNVDMIASPNGGYFVHGDGSDGSPASPASNTAVQVLLGELAATGVTAERVEIDGGSDFVAFVRAGIPSAGVFAGDEEEKTRRQAQLWGGEAGTVFDRCYHQSCDRTDNIDPVMMERFATALGGTIAYFATVHTGG